MENAGPISRIKGFTGEVKAEVLKCTWPTWPELRQSTVVVILSFLLLGLFVALSDFVLRLLLGWFARV